MEWKQYVAVLVSIGSKSDDDDDDDDDGNDDQN